MTFCGGQRDALTTARIKENTIRDAGPSTATAGYTAGLRLCFGPSHKHDSEAEHDSRDHKNTDAFWRSWMTCRQIANEAEDRGTADEQIKSDGRNWHDAPVGEAV